MRHKCCCCSSGNYTNWCHNKGRAQLFRSTSVVGARWSGHIVAFLLLTIEAFLNKQTNWNHFLNHWMVAMLPLLQTSSIGNMVFVLWKWMTSLPSVAFNLASSFGFLNVLWIVEFVFPHLHEIGAFKWFNPGKFSLGPQIHSFLHEHAWCGSIRVRNLIVEG